MCLFFFSASISQFSCFHFVRNLLVQLFSVFNTGLFSGEVVFLCGTSVTPFDCDDFSEGFGSVILSSVVSMVLSTFLFTVFSIFLLTLSPSFFNICAEEMAVKNISKNRNRKYFFMVKLFFAARARKH